MGCLKLKYFCESDLYLGTSLELVHENKNYYPKREVSSKTPQSTLKIVGKNSGQHYRYGFQGHGVSGSGKSTLLKLLSGSLKSEGILTIDKLSPISNTKNGKVSYMFQDRTLLPNLTVLENVTLPLIRVLG